MMEKQELQSNMKVEVFYFTDKAFRENPHDFFMYATKTKEMLDATGLENFRKVTEIHVSTSKSKDDFAEDIFAMFNMDDNPLGSKEGQEKIKSLGVGHTSMSINDFVVMDGEIFIVDGMGFLNIGTHRAVSEVIA